MEIRTVALLGAGAVGSYFIAGLSDKLGGNLWVVAEGERRERLMRDGIVINGKRYELNVRTPEEARGADLLIVSVKYGALRGSLDMIERIVTGDTAVLSPLNGVDSEEIIGERIGTEHMLFSLMKIAAQRVGNEIVYDPKVTQGLFFGEKNNKVSDRVKAVMSLLKGSGVRFMVCGNVERDIWFKYALNISKNLPQAIIGCGFGAYESSEHLAFISEKMRAEVEAVAAAKGIDISDDGNPAGKNAKISPAARFSTLQDLDAKRETEIEMFSGALIKMGRELKVAVPYNEFAYHAIKALEEKNRGEYNW